MSKTLAMDRAVDRLRSICKRHTELSKRLSVVSKALLLVDTMTPQSFLTLTGEITSISAEIEAITHSLANMVTPAAGWRLFAPSDGVIVPEGEGEECR